MLVMARRLAGVSHVADYTIATRSVLCAWLYPSPEQNSAVKERGEEVRQKFKVVFD